ncbi:MAG: tRNA 2-thiouridine(34) synthase MnmA [bacterium]
MEKTFLKHKIVVGMSGGVDSSVAAVLLKEEGYDVIGVHMKYWSEKDEFELCDTGIVNNDPSKANACCSIDSLEDARRVCAKLEIPLYVVDLKGEFKKKIVDTYIEDLKIGLTPNACVICNRDVKFGLLMDYAESIGAEYVATGHYAQIYNDEKIDRYVLKKAVDENKDQSYFLSLLSQKQLSKIKLPLGTLTKDKVREIASQYGLVNSKRRDSQDLCFIANDYKTFVQKYAPSKSGDIILKESGKKIGTHDGLSLYTIGQRKGLSTIINKPLYVSFKDYGNNVLVVDYNAVNDNTKVILKDFNWIKIPNKNTKLNFVGRYQGIGRVVDSITHDGYDVVVGFNDSGVKFSAGQIGALYEGDILIGAGKIID